MGLNNVINLGYLIITLLVSTFAISQQSDYFTLYKGGKKYDKIVGYIMINDNVAKVIDNDSLEVFHIKSSILKHNRRFHSESICTEEDIQFFTINSLDELGLKELQELKLRLEEEGIKNYPNPMNHKILKIYLLENIGDNRFRKVEVEWVWEI